MGPIACWMIGVFEPFTRGIMPSCRHPLIYLLGSSDQRSTVVLFWLHWNSYLRNTLVCPHQGPKRFTVSKDEWSANHPPKLCKLVEMCMKTYFSCDVEISSHNSTRFQEFSIWYTPSSAGLSIHNFMNILWLWEVTPGKQETSEHQVLHIFEQNILKIMKAPAESLSPTT